MPQCRFCAVTATISRCLSGCRKIRPVEDIDGRRHLYRQPAGGAEMIRSGTVFLPICIFTARRRCGRLRKWGSRGRITGGDGPVRPQGDRGQKAATEQFLAAPNPCPERIIKRTFLSRGLHGFCRTAEICRRNRRAPLLVNADSFERNHARENADCRAHHGCSPTERPRFLRPR